MGIDYNLDNRSASSGAGASAIALTANAFVNRVFLWMTFGLLLTGGIAAFVGTTPGLVQKAGSGPLLWSPLIGEFVLVYVLSAKIKSMSSGVAAMMFIAFALLNGWVLSIIFVVYQIGVIANAFFVAASMFAIMGIFGVVTKKDLTSIGQLAMMGVIGLVIAMVVNLFMNSARMDYIISIIGVILFVGLTAYDAQRIKQMAIGVQAGSIDGAMAKKYSILGALTLYLDFINIFLFLLRIMGGGDRR